MIKENNKIATLMVWSCITMFYCYQYILRALPNLAMSDIMTKYEIGATEFGSFAGIYYLGYIAIQIPISILLSRFGGKVVLPICIILTGAGLIPLVYFDSWTMVLAGRMLTGIGSSAAIVGALQVFRIIYPNSFTRMLGIMVFFGLITLVYLGKPIGEILIIWGVSATVNILIYLGVALAIATYLLMPKSASKASDGNIISDIKVITGNYKLILTSICAGLMVGPLEGFADAWGSSFLEAVYNTTKPAADSITFSIYLGMCAGCLILPYIADRTKFYFGITIICGLGMIGCFALILSKAASVNSLYYICILIGVFCAYQVIIISKIATFVSEERSGLAGAVVNMIIMAFGWVFHNSIGVTLDKQWEGEVIEGLKVYSSNDYVNSISIIPAASLIAIIGLSLIILYEKLRAQRA